MELLLEAQAVARRYAYPLTPEQRARRPVEERLCYLYWRIPRLGPAEREEYIRLRAIYPDLGERFPDVDAPLREPNPNSLSEVIEAFNARREELRLTGGSSRRRP